jgi:hypothetical protein
MPKSTVPTDKQWSKVPAMDELKRGSWAVVSPGRVHASGLVYAKAQQLANSLRDQGSSSAEVRPSSVARAMKKELK